MKKQIIIIGGGISGLTLLHFLKKKYADQEFIQVSLFERNDYLGGAIRSLKKEGCLFETGPNGFLNSKQRTLDLVDDLGLTDSLVKANQESEIRYLSLNQKLQKLPINPREFLKTPLLNFGDKCRVLSEVFIPKGNNPTESVYDFGKRRLGEKFAQRFLDPMVSGIYGGDARQSNLKAVFPRIYSLEEEYGSLFKAMIKIRKKDSSKNNSMGSPAGTLTSFKDGVAQLIEKMGRLYADDIHLNQEVKSIVCVQDQYVVGVTGGEQYIADELYICAPAYAAAMMLKKINSPLAEQLNAIEYAPMAVVGLTCPNTYFSEKPKGYGYLIPSSEKKEVLGVLFESNIFSGRCPDDQILFRVMIGGSRHPDILNKSKEDLMKLALDEIELLRGEKNRGDFSGGPRELFFIPWAKAIPQYNLAYCEAMNNIDEELSESLNLHLVANYIKGVSLNDCVEQAYQKAQCSTLV